MIRTGNFYQNGLTRVKVLNKQGSLYACSITAPNVNKETAVLTGKQLEKYTLLN